MKFSKSFKIFLGAILFLLICGFITVMAPPSFPSEFIFGLFGLVLLMPVCYYSGYYGSYYTAVLWTAPRPPFPPFPLKLISILVGFILGCFAVNWATAPMPPFPAEKGGAPRFSDGCSEIHYLDGEIRPAHSCRV